METLLDLAALVFELSAKNFLIRIFRRDPDNPNKVIGTVEDLQKKSLNTFETESELINRLRLDRQSTQTSELRSKGDE